MNSFQGRDQNKLRLYPCHSKHRQILYMLEFRNLYTHDGIFKLIRLLHVYLLNYIFQVKTQAASLTFGLS